MTEQHLINKLKLIEKSLSHLEVTVDNMIKFDTKGDFSPQYWKGRKAAFADLRDLIGNLQEYTDDQNTTISGPATSATNTEGTTSS